MSARPWYKRYGGDFLHGTTALTLEEKGTYSCILDLIYDKGGPIPEDDRWLARVCGCSTRRFRIIKRKLIDAGKIIVRDGWITNERAERELKISENEHDKFVESGSKGGLKTQKKQTQQNENNNLPKKGLDGSDKQARYQNPDTRSQIEEDLPLPPHVNRARETKLTDAEIDQHFENEFWPQYPRKVAKETARKAHARALKAGKITSDEMVAGVLRYAAERSGQDSTFTRHAATWLNGAGWDDEPSPIRSPGQRRRSGVDAALDLMRDENE